MDNNSPQRDEEWNEAVRGETEAQRLDRNWESLLQEVRVTQTGVQLLTGFLLILPFQQRFTMLNDTMRVVYLVAVGCSIASTILVVAPVGMHRVLFRQHRLDTLVATTHRCAIAGLLLLGAGMVGVAIVVFSAVAGSTAGWIAGGCTAAGFGSFWLGLPLFQRKTTSSTP